MPKGGLTAPVVGRGQAARPAAAVAPREGERHLVGALSVPIEQIVSDPDQPRKTWDADRLRELADSIKEHGVLQPLLVREDGYLDDARTRYRIVAGERRYRAAQMAGLTRLPVLLNDSDEAKVRIMQLLENVQRENLEPVEEARCYKELMDLRNMGARGMAALVHRSQAYITERLVLLKDERVAAAVSAGHISKAIGVEIARARDADERQDLLRQATAGRLRESDVRARRTARRAAEQPAAGQEMTVREAGALLGITNEAVLHLAAETRHAEPDLSPAEAVTLAAHSGAGTNAATTHPQVSAVSEAARDIPVCLEIRLSRRVHDRLEEVGNVLGLSAVRLIERIVTEWVEHAAHRVD
jgi:ParB/RepB/Spo0J family partition protein